MAQSLAQKLLLLTSVALAATSMACGSANQSDTEAPSEWQSPAADTGTGWGPSDGGMASDSGGSYGSVGVGGGQDFAAFRKALDEGKIPGVDSIDSTGFFAEHYTSLPKPECGKTFCLHSLLSVSNDLVHPGKDWTLLQMGMNSPIDPSTIKKPNLDIVVVLDHSGSMDASDKMTYARDGVKLLIDGLGTDDTFTLIAFDSAVDKLYGPAKITDKIALKSMVDGIKPAGATNIYDALEAGYKAALAGGDEQMQRRVIFLTDGLPTAGNTSSVAIKAMSAGYNDKYVGLTTIGLGADVDAGLLRSLAEKGGGNFYFVEKLDAVKEVFTEELAFFVAPIAYDLDLTFQELPSYGLDTVYGTGLWSKTSTGGTVHIPSVFLVSRTSSAPGPTGGRRGGGAAIIANLQAKAVLPAGLHDVAKVQLKYRMPGSTTYETQETTVTYDGVPGKAPTGGYYQDKGIEKNTVMLAFFIAFQDATKLANAGNRADARKLLQEFQPRIKDRLSGWTDEDLLDDLKILQQYIDVLGKS